MKIILAGGSGFLGNALKDYFDNGSNEVYVLTRNPIHKNDIFWDAKNMGKWANILENAEVLINLTGKSVDCRYTDQNKEIILNSRIDSTRILQTAIDSCINPPKIWLNSSSATIYIHAETQLMTETHGIIGDDFSMNICKAWEKEFFEKDTPKTRKVALRTSIVLGNKGGAFPKMKTITKLGLGGKQGLGNQKMSWIHIQDFCSAIEFIINQNSIKGAINITAPNPIHNWLFMRQLRQSLGILFGLASPRFLLEFASIFIKTETELLLKSRNVYPEKLINEGFNFKYDTIEKAFNDLCK